LAEAQWQELERQLAVAVEEVDEKRPAPPVVRPIPRRRMVRSSYMG
jgi:hypothetical protein